MHKTLADVINLEQHPLHNDDFRIKCKRTLNENGALVIPNFLKPSAIASIQREGEENKHLAYYTVNNHNIYLTTPDPEYPADHPRNQEVSSSKGCITTDQIPTGSALHTLYDAPEFREFLCTVLGEEELHEYADALSSINLHYASEGQELGWHYDNSSFAITLMIQSPESGGEFEYVKDVRDADSGDMNYKLSGEILAGEVPTETLSMDAGALVMFRGRNSMHRVTPVVGNRTRMLVVLAYNTEPGISLSEPARMTFFGRLG
ncbi:2OG-Fe(II) oxygenase [Oceanospirillum sp.]|uniref:HalD/BesD family halogenase n=1 Tax=Oceanospirillum sp. TaxID=2021254 RepID=UPI003A90E6CA